MKTEIIEKYIQFAMDNGYNTRAVSFTGLGKENYSSLIFKDKIGWTKIVNLIELITSKEFLEAIERGIWEKGKQSGYCKVTPVGMYDSRTKLYEVITRDQALAIRDDKLEDFITNLLNLGNEK